MPKIDENTQPLTLYRTFTTAQLREFRYAFSLDLAQLRTKQPESHRDVQFALGRLQMIGKILTEREELD